VHCVRNTVPGAGAYITGWLWYQDNIRNDLSRSPVCWISVTFRTTHLNSSLCITVVNSRVNLCALQCFRDERHVFFVSRRKRIVYREHVKGDMHPRSEKRVMV
jgi:hypothetical protein